MTQNEVRHKTLQVANSASLILLSRAMTAVGVPLMLFFASEVWTDIDDIKDKMQKTDITLTEMQGDMKLLQFRVNSLGATSPEVLNEPDRR